MAFKQTYKNRGMNARIMGKLKRKGTKDEQEIIR